MVPLKGIGQDDVLPSEMAFAFETYPCTEFLGCDSCSGFIAEIHSMVGSVSKPVNISPSKNRHCSGVISCSPFCCRDRKPRCRRLGRRFYDWDREPRVNHLSDMFGRRNWPFCPALLNLLNICSCGHPACPCHDIDGTARPAGDLCRTEGWELRTSHSPCSGEGGVVVAVQALNKGRPWC